MQRSLSALRVAAASHVRAVAQHAAATPVQHARLLARVNQLGLSARAFSQARLTLNAAAPQTPAKEAAPATAAKAEAPAAASSAVAAAPAAQSFSDIVQRYGGWYPFIGLAGVIAVSKEVIILNEELLLVSNFAAMFATLYFALGDTLTKAAEEQRAEIAKRQDELSDFEIEQLQALIQAHELNIEQVNVLKRLKAEHNELSSQLVVAKDLKVRHAARDALVKKLGDVRAREASERSMFRQAVAGRATDYVRRSFAGLPAAQKNGLIDFAISVVEGKASKLDAKQDPVKQLYTKYFDEQIYTKEMAGDKRK